MEDTLTPSETVKLLTNKSMTSKVSYNKTKTFILAILAGAFVAFGAVIAITSTTGNPNLGWGFNKLISGITFATALIMVVLTGAELFTGNVMIAFSWLDKKIKLIEYVKNLFLVYFGNMVGGLVVVALVFLSSWGTSCNDVLGVNSMNIASAKINLTFVEAFCRGILCNWLVCLAVVMASSTKNVAGKILAIIFPIMTFAAAGFKHSVANMFFIPNGIMMKYIPTVVTTSGFTTEQLNNLSWSGFVQNLIPVTLGNIVGAFIFVVLFFWIAYIYDEKRYK